MSPAPFFPRVAGAGAEARDRKSKDTAMSDARPCCAVNLRSTARPSGKALCVDSLRQFPETGDRCAGRIGERLDHGEMVPGELAIARFRHALPPSLRHGPALALEFV